MNARLDGEFREFMSGRWPTIVRLAYGLTGDQGHEHYARGEERGRPERVPELLGIGPHLLATAIRAG